MSFASLGFILVWVENSIFFLVYFCFLLRASRLVADGIVFVSPTEFKSLCQMELENAEILSDENASLYEKLRKSYDHLYRGVSA